MEHMPEFSFSRGTGGIGGRGQLFSTTVSPDFCIAPTRDSHQHVLLGAQCSELTVCSLSVLYKRIRRNLPHCIPGDTDGMSRLIHSLTHSLIHSFAFSSHSKPNAILGSEVQNPPTLYQRKAGSTPNNK